MSSTKREKSNTPLLERVYRFYLRHATPRLRVGEYAGEKDFLQSISQAGSAKAVHRLLARIELEFKGRSFWDRFVQRCRYWDEEMVEILIENCPLSLSGMIVSPAFGNEGANYLLQRIKGSIFNYGVGDYSPTLDSLGPGLMENMIGRGLVPLEHPTFQKALRNVKTYQGSSEYRRAVLAHPSLDLEMVREWASEPSVLSREFYPQTLFYLCTHGNEEELLWAWGRLCDASPRLAAEILRKRSFPLSLRERLPQTSWFELLSSPHAEIREQALRSFAPSRSTAFLTSLLRPHGEGGAEKEHSENLRAEKVSRPLKR